MLKFLTQKLKSQSLNEVSPYIPTDQVYIEDSGNESEDEDDCELGKSIIVGQTNSAPVSPQSSPITADNSGIKGKSYRLLHRSRTSKRHQQITKIPTESNINNNNISVVDRNSNHLSANVMDNNSTSKDDVQSVGVCEKVYKSTCRFSDTVSIASSATSDWSRTSFASTDFDASDDELISINSEAALVSSRESSASSSKRKRVSTIAVDEEVEALFVENESSNSNDSLASELQLAFRPVSCCSVWTSCGASPRKRHRSGLDDDSRPFLDLEKMQHEKVPNTIDEPKAVVCNRPRTIRIRCLNPIKRINHRTNYSSSSNDTSNQDLQLNSLFCPLTPVEHPAVCYS